MGTCFGRPTPAPSCPAPKNSFEIKSCVMTKQELIEYKRAQRRERIKQEQKKREQLVHVYMALAIDKMKQEPHQFRSRHY